MGAEAKKPNIVWFHVDNLGLGEVGCYGGGKVRGAETRRIDQFSREGLQLWHYVTEPQCTPSRSALMTGRRAIRSCTHTVALAGEVGGIVAWQRTMGDVLSESGYATACFGKWHIGAESGRWPTDHGFDEWYGPPRSYDECLWPDDPWYDPHVAPVSYMMEGRKGEPPSFPFRKRTLLAANKIDVEGAAKAFEDLGVLVEGPFERLAVSAASGRGLEVLRRAVFDLLRVVRVYSKIPGKKAEKDAPFALKVGSTVMDMAKAVHKDFSEKLQYARVWNASGLDGLRVNRDYVLADEDVVELHI